MVSLKCLQEIDNLDRLIIRSEIESVMKHQEMAGYLKKGEVTKGETVGFVAPYNK